MATTTENITWVWEGTDKRGVKLKGEKSARSQSMVRADLLRQGIQPKVVKRKPKALFGGSGKSIKAKDIAVFSRQIATMLHAGVPLMQALGIISGASENPRMTKLITAIKTEVESGSTLNEALAKHPTHFDELYINLVAAGETAGVLDSVLDTIATYKERIEGIKGKVKKAMYYPIAVLAVAVGVSAILLIKVIPQFESVFANFGAELPFFTKIIVEMSRSMQSKGYIYFIVLIAAIVGLLQAKKRSKAFAHFLDRMMLKLPIIGEVLRKAALARFARTLSITFNAGVPLVEALDTVAGATGNIVFEEAVMQMKEQVAGGHQLQLAMQQASVFPAMIVQMTAIGEEAGSLDSMLLKSAEFYEEEVNNTVDALSSLLEPIVIVIIGGMVGGMV
ncbi:MAG: type II secretion system F family protein, partial [Xanthomonadales bacterium]|nr:type II secretion system F family protein [Xanthomonadales bacterium]